MKYWIVKFAPFRISWENILASGKFEIYSVRNAQSRNNLEQMKMGDLAFYYHSQTDKQIMGIMEVTKEAHQDFTTTDPRWKSVTFEPVDSLQSPIPLSLIKSTPSLKNLFLIRQPRLAVGEITENEFTILKSLAKRQ